MASMSSNVSREDGASPIISPVTGKRTAMTARMRPWSGAVSNNNKENKKKKTGFLQRPSSTRGGSAGPVYVSSIGVTGRHAPEALHTIFTRSVVWFPVAHRIYTFLPIATLRQLFQDVGSVYSCCFVLFS